MNRPVHTYAGFRRYIQMSRSRVFIFVEGRELDRFFYSEVCGPICSEYDVRYEVVGAERLDQSGGKTTLLGFYKFLLECDSLIDKSGAVTISVFFLDKDVDDLFRELIVSPHIIYTPGYSVENALFAFGDVVRAGAAASSLDAGEIRARIPNAAEWRKAVAIRWKDFVVLCLFVRKYGLQCDCTYRRRTSPLNNPPDVPSDQNGIRARKDSLQAHLGLRAGPFDRKFRAAEKTVEVLYSRNLHDSIFNGKWYFEILKREIEVIANGRTYNRHALINGLRAALAVTLNFNEPWAGHFRLPFRQLVEQHFG